MGNGKNTIASPKRLQPLASRPQVRTLGAIIYFDVSNPSGVCFNSFYLSCWPVAGPKNHPRRSPSSFGAARSQFLSGSQVRSHAA